MQIIIVQSEIETAIKKYVTSLVQVQAGTTIEIDLRATRGAEGFQAIIDIRASDDDGDDNGPSEPEPKDPTPAPTTVNKVTSGGRAKKPEAKAEEPVKPAADTAPETNGEDGSDDGVEHHGEDHGADEEAGLTEKQKEQLAPEREEPAAASEAPKSIFGAKKVETAPASTGEAAAAAEAPSANEAPRSIFANAKRPVNA